uniref:Transposase n=1 Tax=Streptococcus suis TaxID=1307 RepID=G8DU84_STRSU|nr:transposase [Streptococcus suis]
MTVWTSAVFPLHFVMNNLWSELTKNSLTNSLSFLAFIGDSLRFNWVSQRLLQAGFPPQTSSADRVDALPSLMIFRRVSVSDTQPVHEGGSTRW